MSTETRLAEARLAIAAADSTLSMEAVEERARRFVDHEKTQEALANFAKAAAEQERADDAERERRRRVIGGEEEPSGASSAEIIAALKMAQENGEGW